MNIKLALPAAVVTALAGTAVMAQSARPAAAPRGGIAVPSRDPSGRTFMGQGPTTPVRGGGGGAGAAAVGARPGVVLPPRPIFRPIAVPSRDPSGRTFMGQGPTTPVVPGGGGAGAAAAGGFRPSAQAPAVPRPVTVGSVTSPTAAPPVAVPNFASGLPGVVPGGNTAFGPGGGTTFGGVFGNDFTGGFPAGFANNAFGTNGFNGFNSQFGFDPFLGGFQDFGFFPGFAATPYFGGFYGGYPGYGGVYSFNNGIAPAYNPASFAGANLRMPRSPLVPVLGVNVAPPRLNSNRYASARARVRTDPKTFEDFDRARRVRVVSDGDGTREEIREEAATDEAMPAAEARITDEARDVRFAPATADQVRLAAKAERIMTERPMREGAVTRISGSSVDVNYTLNGRSRTGTFPADEVFFFRPSGEMETAATAGGTLNIGDRVLIASGDTPQPRQAVAGSRQEKRGAAAARTKTTRSKARSKQSRSRRY